MKRKILKLKYLRTTVKHRNTTFSCKQAIFKQIVGAQDVYLGLSDKDVSSNSCDGLVLKVKLPGTVLKEIGLEVKSQSIHLQTGKYLLNYTAPYPIVKDSGIAKWISDKEILEVTVLY